MVGAAIGGVASIAGGVIGSSSASKAAKAQENAASQAAAVQQNMYNQTRSDLMPFQLAGQSGTNQLMGRLVDLTAPMQMTQAQLEATPGYQFTLSQGLKSTNNALGARGLLNSGAVMKGASAFATGLADNTYQNQFNNYQTQQTNAFNKLMGVATLGEDAAAKTGATGTQTAGVQSQAYTNAGNAAATGYTNSGNALTNAMQGVGNAYYSARGGVFGNGNGFNLPSGFGSGQPISVFNNPDYTYG